MNFQQISDQVDRENFSIFVDSQHWEMGDVILLPEEKIEEARQAIRRTQPGMQIAEIDGKYIVVDGKKFILQEKKAGKTFEGIGDQLGLTRQRCQLLSRYESGGGTKWSSKGHEWRSQYEAGETIQGIAEKEGCNLETVRRQIKKAGGIIDRHRKRGKKK